MLDSYHRRQPLALHFTRLTLLHARRWLPQTTQQCNVDAPRAIARPKVQVVGVVEEVGVEQHTAVLPVRHLDASHRRSLYRQPVVDLDRVAIVARELPPSWGLNVIDLPSIKAAAADWSTAPGRRRHTSVHGVTT